MNVGDKVIVDGKETEITATAFDEEETKVYMVKGSMKDYYEEELKLIKISEAEIELLLRLDYITGCPQSDLEELGIDASKFDVKEKITNLISKYKEVSQKLLDNRNLFHENMYKAKKEIERLKDKIDDLEMNNAEYERREKEGNKNMVATLEESLKYCLEIKNLEEQNKEQEKMIELMAQKVNHYVLLEDGINTRPASTEEKIEYFRRKAKGD